MVRRGRPGIVPVFINDWYIAAFSGDASMVEPSRLMRPVASSAISSANPSFKVHVGELAWR